MPAGYDGVRVYKETLSRVYRLLKWVGDSIFACLNSVKLSRYEGYEGSTNNTVDPRYDDNICSKRCCLKMDLLL